MDLKLIDNSRFALAKLTAQLAATGLLLAGCAGMGMRQHIGETPAQATAPALAAAAPATAPATPPASATASAPQAAASAPAGAASSARPPVDPAAPKPFADIIKDAKQQAGLFPIWRKDEKVWLEIPKAGLNKPFLFTVNVANSVGERGLYASQMSYEALVEWRRIGNQMQLIAINTKYRGDGAGGGSKLAVSQGFSPSLVAGMVVASAEHPERKSVLVDAAFMLSDIAGYSTRIESAFRLPFGLDRSNSFFEATRADTSISTLNARVHFATPRIPAPPMTPSLTPMPKPPQATPDPRSFFVTFVYNFSALPDKPMAARLSDPRLGHFTETFNDLSSDQKPNSRVHYVSRWRLEKKDPAAALSEPVKPIVYWMDKNIPPKYRAAVASGITEWNKAFEKIGFKDAVQAQQQPDDADWDNMDSVHASIRWFVGADVGFAIGPSSADPRTGEILDADIGMSDVFARGSRRFIVEDAGTGSEGRLAQFMASNAAGRTGLTGHKHDRFCTYAHEAASEMDFALDVLEARGDIAPDGPEAEAFVQDVIKDTIMHEVGHTLGLKHNFKASTTVSRTQLQDKNFTESQGISGSVMDYNAYNLALQGESQAALNNKTLGAYDYWAIEFAYKPLDAASEAAELAKIASRSVEPALAYADDGDAGGFGSDGMDPLVNRFDLGDDPLAYYKRRLKLSQELWARVQARKPQAGDDPLRQRRSLLAGFSQLQRASELVGKYVGGMYTLRDLPGSNTGRANFKPVEPDKQREALQFLATGLFSVDSFKFDPKFLANLGVDYNEWERDGPVNLRAVVLRAQTTAMDRLLAGGTAQRLLDLPNYLEPAERKGMISLSEVYATLQSSIWSELKNGSEIDGLRRNLQREHLRRLQTTLTRGAPGLPADALSLARLHATRLQTELRTAVARSGSKSAGNISIETQAHLAESLGILNESLRATMQRS